MSSNDRRVAVLVFSLLTVSGCAIGHTIPCSTDRDCPTGRLCESGRCGFPAFDVPDAAHPDAHGADASTPDAWSVDTSIVVDTGVPWDAGTDAASPDAPDASSPDAWMPDAGPPARTFATYVAGSGSDEATDVAIASDGSVIVVGSTLTSDLGTGCEAGGRDAWVARFAADGTLAWLRCLPGAMDDEATSVAIDEHATPWAIVVGGHTLSPGVTTSGAADQSFGTAGNREGFVARLDFSGNVAYLTYVGGDASDDSVDDLDVVSTDGTVFALVSTTGNLPFTMRGTRAGAGELAVVRLQPDGASVPWAAWVGGTGSELTGSLAVSGTQVFVAASTGSLAVGTCTRTTGGQEVLAWSADVATGMSTVCHWHGGTSNERVESHSLALDNNGNLLLAVSTQSTELCTGLRGTAVAVIQLRANNLLALTPPDQGVIRCVDGANGTSYDDYARAIATSSDGSYCVLMQTKSPDLADTAPASGLTAHGDYDVYVACGRGTTTTFSTYVGGSLADGGSTSEHVGGIALTGDGRAGIATVTQSTSIPTSPGAAWSTSSSPDDGFVALIDN